MSRHSIRMSGKFNTNWRRCLSIRTSRQWDVVASIYLYIRIYRFSSCNPSNPFARYLARKSSSLFVRWRERERKRKKKRKDFNMKYLFPPRVKRVLNGLPLNNDRVSRQRPASRGRNLRRNTVVEFFPEFTITGIRITWKRAYPSGTAASYNTSAIQSV